MSELFEAVQKRLLKEKDCDETAALWRRIWEHCEEDGLAGVQELINDALVAPREDK